MRFIISTVFLLQISVLVFAECTDEGPEFGDDKTCTNTYAYNKKDPVICKLSDSVSICNKNKKTGCFVKNPNCFKKNETPVTDTTPVDESKYNPSTCKWAKDMPRKIIQGPGCTGDNVSQFVLACTGYITCRRVASGAYFVRMATCDKDLCADGKEEECVNDMSFKSRRQDGGEKKFYMDQSIETEILKTR